MMICAVVGEREAKDDSVDVGFGKKGVLPDDGEGVK